MSFSKLHLSPSVPKKGSDGVGINRLATQVWGI